MLYKVYSEKGIISGKCKLLNTFFSKLNGLMFSKLRFGDAVLLESRREGISNTAIHMFFVFYSLDIVWLNSALEVVDIKKVYPFTPYVAPKKPAKYVLEIKDAGDLEVGDKIRVVPFS